MSLNKKRLQKLAGLMLEQHDFDPSDEEYKAKEQIRSARDDQSRIRKSFSTAGEVYRVIKESEGEWGPQNPDVVFLNETRAQEYADAMSGAPDADGDAAKFFVEKFPLMK